MAILDLFKQPKKVYLDTNCFIYLFEHHEIFYQPSKAIFDTIARSKGRIVTSELTLAEILVKPYKTQNHQLVKDYEIFLNNQNIIDLIKIDQSILKVASQIKAKYKTPLADAVHIASSETTIQCDIFVTNDEKMRGLEHLQKCQVIFLSSLL